MFEIASNVNIEDGKVVINASVNCPTGGYSLELATQQHSDVFVLTVTLKRPFPGEMVTQATTTPTLDARVEIPEGANRVCVFIEPCGDPSYDFEL